MLTNYPTSIVVHGMALNITVQSYDRSLDFGLMADALAMPDVRELADAITIASMTCARWRGPANPTPEAEPPPGVVGRAARGLGGAVTGVMGKVARQVMAHGGGNGCLAGDRSH